MIYYTNMNRCIRCPLWDVEIQLKGKYIYDETPGHEYEAKFASAECPIIKNNHLPQYKRDKKLSYYPFCSEYPCKELSNFLPVIDVRTNKAPK